MAGNGGNSNGSVVSNRVAWWIVGILSTLILFAATTFAAHVESTLAAHGAMLAARGERITALERDVVALLARVARLEQAAGGH